MDRITVFIKGIGMVRVVEENRNLLKKYGKENLLPVLPKVEEKKEHGTDHKGTDKPNTGNGKRTRNK